MLDYHYNIADWDLKQMLNQTTTQPHTDSDADKKTRIDRWT